MIELFFSNPTFVAGTFTIVGGLLLKILEKYLGKHADRRDDRKDYRETISELHDRIDHMQDDIDELRRNLYASQEEAALLRMYIIRHNLELPTDEFKTRDKDPS